MKCANTLIMDDNVHRITQWTHTKFYVRNWGICVCICVREREREWGRKGGKEREFEETVLKEIKQAVV